MKTRNAKRSAANVTEAQFEEAVAKYAVAEQRENAIRKNIELGVNELVSAYEPELQVLAQGKSMAFGIAQAYCTNNKETLFAKRRSIGTQHGIAGFRLGTPRLKPTKGSSWHKALAVLKEKLPAYVRTVEEPAKDLLLAHRSSEKVASLLLEIGIQVVQDELFYMETKKAA